MTVQSISPERRYAKRRHGVLRLARHTRAVDAMLITDATNIRYLTGLHEGGSALLFADKWSVLITSAMFRHVADAQTPGCEVMVPERRKDSAVPSLDELLASVVKRRRVRKIGYEDNLMTVSRFRNLTKHIKENRLFAFSGLVVSYRAVKDSVEIEAIRKAVKISERAFRELMRRGADYFAGKTEKQLAAELEYLMRGYGADRQGFQGNGIIVASGPNSASCHHMPSRRKIRRGDPVLIDWGAELDGYRSDMTRVLFVGSVPSVYEKIYPPVETAMREATAAIRPGVRAHSVDTIARKVIDQAGYAEQFTHSLGHGIGLQIHEQPNLCQGPPVPLKKGMVITVEPGVYLAGVGGVRLENNVLVTADGHERLSTIPTALSRMVLR